MSVGNSPSKKYFSKKIQFVNVIFKIKNLKYFRLNFSTEDSMRLVGKIEVTVDRKVGKRTAYQL